jgi:hypothetical protein
LWNYYFILLTFSICFSGAKIYKSKSRIESSSAAGTAIELNDCLLESENIQITKKDDHYLLQPVKSESKQTPVKYILQECGKLS